MICDYRTLSMIPICDSNQLPLIGEALEQIARAKIFSQITLIGAYLQMRIRAEDSHRAAVGTRFGAFERRVLCFDVTNAPDAFSRLLTSLLRELNEECLLLILDTFFVKSRSVDEQKEQ